MINTLLSFLPPQSLIHSQVFPTQVPLQSREASLERLFIQNLCRHDRLLQLPSWDRAPWIAVAHSTAHSSLSPPSSALWSCASLERLVGIRRIDRRIPSGRILDVPIRVLDRLLGFPV